MSEKNEENQKHKGEGTGASASGRQGKQREPKKDWLGDQLRELYQSYSDEPLPDDLKDVLRKLGEPKDSKDSSEGPT